MNTVVNIVGVSTMGFYSITIFWCLLYIFEPCIIVMIS